jgi:glyoxylase-like metal-dependent hydrolase (beta-lactamase superfamily II)
MDGVFISEDQVISLDDIAEGVRGLRIVFVNVFAVTHPNGSWSLIDAALPLSASHIRNWAEKHFTAPPNALILTHGHFDHVSAAEDLAEEWNIPIYAHSLEVPYLSGQKEYPEPNAGAGGGMMTLLSPLYPRGPIDVGSRLVDFSDGDDGVIYSGLPKLRDLPEMPGWKILHSPGHTLGHVSLFRPSDRTLLAFHSAFAARRTYSNRSTHRTLQPLNWGSVSLTVHEKYGFRQLLWA